MKVQNLIQRITGSLALLTALVILTPNAGRAGAFTAGNLVVYRAGTGAAALNNSSTAAFLDEYTTSGTSVQSIALPTTASGGNRAMTCTGNATSEGQITLSPGGSYIACGGYDAAPGIAGINSSASSTYNRIIGRVDASGNVDSSTALSAAYNASNIRGTVIAGSSFYSCGAVSPSVGYSTYGGTTATSLTSANARAVNAFGGDLYFTTSSTLQKFTGLPTSSATPTSLLTGLTSAGAFVFLDVGNSGSLNTCYLVDGPTLRKYSVSGGTLTANGTATFSGGSSGISGLAAKVSGTTVTLYLSSTGKIETITDSGTLSGAATTLVTAAANTAFRGIAFAPVISVAVAATAAPAAGSLDTGTTDVPVFGFQLTPIGPTADFTALKLTTTGTATSSDLSNFRVVYDADNSGTYNGGDTVVSGSGLSLANLINFTITGQTGFSAPRRYLLIANVAGGATLGHTFTGNIAAAGDVTTTPAPQGTAAGNRQTIGIDMTMSAVASSESATISSLLNDATITSTSQGAQVWQVTFNNPAGAAGVGTISAITFTPGGNNGVANWQNTIQAAELFDGATPLAAGTINPLNIAFSGLSVNVADGGSKMLSLRISLKSTAGALTDNTTFQFALAATDVTASGNGVVNADPIISDPAQNKITVVATRLVFTSLPTFVLVSSTFTGTVQAQDANGNRDLDDTTGVAITKTSGSGILGGGSIFNLIAGLHSFSSLTYDTVGDFSVTASGGTLTSATSTITAEAVATATEVIMPQYIQGIASGSSNSKRLPFAFRATLSNLLPNATYRYYNMAVVSTDTATDGAGNCIFVTPSGDFVRTASTGMNTAGGYGEFTADATGAYTGWFVLEPTGNAARFTAGTSIFMQIMLNNGLGGTSVFQRVRTASPVTVLAFATTADPNTGTGIRGSSFAPAKNFVLLYDNTTGTGQPLTGTFAESDGVAENTAVSYVSFYSTSVDGTSGAWGAIIPNNLPNGVQRIEQRALSDGSVVQANTDSDGVWPSGASTVSPFGGDATPIVITASDAPLGVAPPTVPNITRIQVVSGNVLIDFTGGTSDTITSFTVLSTANLATPLAPITANFSTSGPGLFRATVTGVTPTAFYRIRRP